MANPIVRDDDITRRSRISCRRLTRSPNGEISRSPTAYPAWTSVGILKPYQLYPRIADIGTRLDTSSYVTLNETARSTERSQ
jgi:hypothetical protein